MQQWWSGLTLTNQAFWGLAVFFSTLFVWQFLASFSGLVAGVGADVALDIESGVDAGTDDGNLQEDAEGVATFRLMSARSVLAFGTLFSWAGALYLGGGLALAGVIALATIWGIAGMLVVAVFFWVLPKLTEEGTVDLRAAVGTQGTVYIGIPEGGAGQVRVRLGDRTSYVRARTVGGFPLRAGVAVRVTDVLDGGVLEVEPNE